jgi:siroheme synthase
MSDFTVSLLMSECKRLNAEIDRLKGGPPAIDGKLLAEIRRLTREVSDLRAIAEMSGGEVHSLFQEYDQEMASDESP